MRYDGTEFNGWQRQSHAPSVQAVLEDALSRVADRSISVVAAGRTDTGVHATGQLVSFKSEVARPERAWVMGGNAHLPDGVAIRWARTVSDDFHARFSAVSRRYLYLIEEGGGVHDPLSRQRVVASGAPSGAPSGALDDASMHQAAQALVGEHDFTTFRAAGCQSNTPWRRVHRATVTRWGSLVGIDVEANAFLLRMMRNIASALLAVGQGQRQVASMAELLAARDRTALGKTAPPEGLYLIGVRSAGAAPSDTIDTLEAPPLLRALGPGAL